MKYWHPPQHARTLKTSGWTKTVTVCGHLHEMPTYLQLQKTEGWGAACQTLEGLGHGSMWSCHHTEGLYNSKCSKNPARSTEWVTRQTGLHRETLFQNNKQTQKTATTKLFLTLFLLHTSTTIKKGEELEVLVNTFNPSTYQLSD